MGINGLRIFALHPQEFFSLVNGCIGTHIKDAISRAICMSQTEPQIPQLPHSSCHGHYRCIRTITMVDKVGIHSEWLQTYTTYILRNIGQRGELSRDSLYFSRQTLAITIHDTATAKKSIAHQKESWGIEQNYF